MGLTMQLAEFGSRAVRTAITPDGIRKFTVSALGKQSEEGTNIISFLWNGALRFTGFLVNDVIKMLFGGLQFSFSALLGLIFQAIGFVWNFNWNESDEEFNKSLESGLESLAGQLGFFLGDVLGHVVCGVVPGTVVFAFNEGLALHIFETLGEAALGDVAGNLAGLIQQAGQYAGQALLTYAYTNIRSLLRGGSDEEFKKKLIARGIVKKEDIQKALETRNKPWSFAKAFDHKVEQIPNKTVREMVKQGVQGIIQACMTDGYAIAGGLDSWMASHKVANANILGNEETVSIQLHRSPTGTSTPTPPTKTQ